MDDGLLITASQRAKRVEGRHSRRLIGQFLMRKAIRYCNFIKSLSLFIEGAVSTPSPCVQHASASASSSRSSSLCSIRGSGQVYLVSPVYIVDYFEQDWIVKQTNPIASKNRPAPKAAGRVLQCRNAECHSAGK